MHVTRISAIIVLFCKKNAKISVSPRNFSHEFGCLVCHAACSHLWLCYWLCYWHECSWHTDCHCGRGRVAALPPHARRVGAAAACVRRRRAGRRQIHARKTPRRRAQTRACVARATADAAAAADTVTVTVTVRSNDSSHNSRSSGSSIQSSICTIIVVCIFFFILNGACLELTAARSGRRLPGGHRSHSDRVCLVRRRTRRFPARNRLLPRGRGGRSEQPRRGTAARTHCSLKCHC